MRQRSPLRGMAIAFFVITISFWNFSRLTGSECIRTIHIVTLLTAGAGVGVFIMSFFSGSETDHKRISCYRFLAQPLQLIIH